MARMKWVSGWLALGFFALAIAAPTFAGGKKDDGKKEGDKEPERKLDPTSKAIRAVHAAYEIAAIGKEKNSPEALIAAAKILGVTGREKSELSKEDKVGKLKDFDERKEASALLDEALKMAKGTDTESAIKTLVAEARKDIKEFKRGGVFGGRNFSGFFQGDNVDTRDTFHLRARGGAWLEISLNGWGPPGLDLDLELYEGGSLIRSERSVGPNSFISHFVPHGSPRNYRIVVINYTGGTPCDQYTLCHN